MKKKKKTRGRGEIYFSLRTRLIFFVTLEMLVCILIAFGLDALVNWIIPGEWEMPLVLELFFVCMLVGILVTNQLSKFFFDPIRRLRKAMDEVAEGDFSIRLEETSRAEEIMDIYSGFNLMANELAATEILQTDFVSNVSHEFKTPINAIEGYSTLLQDSENLSDEQRQY
ncbi:MAG: HAMP domain-containing protein, partial [Bacteroidales bacterium]|nr:HAMP domain-containing protein [Bacteroidales bacterium]